MDNSSNSSLSTIPDRHLTGSHLDTHIASHVHFLMT
jgi:hypothetical protein